VRASGLESFLAQLFRDARDLSVHDLRRIPGGASRETWEFEVSWRAGESRFKRALIARCDPKGSVLGNRCEVEYELLRRLEELDAPIPRLIGIDREGTALGAPTIVMERVVGTTDVAAIRESAPPEEIAQRMTRVLALIHSLDLTRMSGVIAAPPNDCASNEIESWERILRRRGTGAQPVVELGLGWLRRHYPPAPPALTLVHGDFRFGNVMMSSGEVAAVLDWEMAHAGDPLEDLAWLVSGPWRDPSGKVAGICSPESLICAYERESRREINRSALKFWEVFANVKFAVLIAAGARVFLSARSTDLILPMSALFLPRVELEILELIR
jgi:aminoglycoside phosphotransferase (APT) family kinase protein